MTLQKPARPSFAPPRSCSPLSRRGASTPAAPGSPRSVEQGRWTHWLDRPRFSDRCTPQQQWLDAFRAAVAGDAFNDFHRLLHLSDDQVRACFSEGDVCQAPGPVLAARLLEWSRASHLGWVGGQGLRRDRQRPRPPHHPRPSALPVLPRAPQKQPQGLQHLYRRHLDGDPGLPRPADEFRTRWLTATRENASASWSAAVPCRFRARPIRKKRQRTGALQNLPELPPPGPKRRHSVTHAPPGTAA